MAATAAAKGPAFAAAPRRRPSRPGLGPGLGLGLAAAAGGKGNADSASDSASDSDSDSASASAIDEGRTTARSMYAVPAIFTPTDSRPVVLFDGSCNLCNFGVQLVLDYDSCTADDRGNLRVAALQSEVGRVLLERLDGPTRDMVLRHRSEGEGGEGDEAMTAKKKTKTTTRASSSAVLIGPG